MYGLKNGINEDPAIFSTPGTFSISLQIAAKLAFNAGDLSQLIMILSGFIPLILVLEYFICLETPITLTTSIRYVLKCKIKNELFHFLEADFSDDFPESNISAGIREIL